MTKGLGKHSAFNIGYDGSVRHFVNILVIIYSLHTLASYIQSNIKKSKARDCSKGGGKG